jgi:hypothetical protein
MVRKSCFVIDAQNNDTQHPKKAKHSITSQRLC